MSERAPSPALPQAAPAPEATSAIVASPAPCTAGSIAPSAPPPNPQPSKPSIGVTLLRVTFDLAADLAGASVGTAYTMTVAVVGTTAATATSVATNTAGLLATFAVRVLLGDGAAAVVGVASRAAAVTASTAVQTSVSAAGGLVGTAVGLGVALLIKGSGRALAYAGSALLNTTRARSVAQTGFTCTALAPGLRVHECETDDGVVLITLQEAEEEEEEEAYVMVVPPKVPGAVVPFQREPSRTSDVDTAAEAEAVTDTTPPSSDASPLPFAGQFVGAGIPIPVGIPLPGWIVESRLTGGDGGGEGAEWARASWDATVGAFEIPVPDPTVDVELRARPAVVE